MLLICIETWQARVNLVCHGGTHRSVATAFVLMLMAYPRPRFFPHTDRVLEAARTYYWLTPLPPTPYQRPEVSWCGVTARTMRNGGRFRRPMKSRWLVLFQQFPGPTHHPPLQCVWSVTQLWSSCEPDFLIDSVGLIHGSRRVAGARRPIVWYACIATLS